MKNSYINVIFYFFVFFLLIHFSNCECVYQKVNYSLNELKKKKVNPELSKFNFFENYICFEKDCYALNFKANCNKNEFEDCEKYWYNIFKDNPTCFLLPENQTLYEFNINVEESPKLIFSATDEEYFNKYHTLIGGSGQCSNDNECLTNKCIFEKTEGYTEFGILNGCLMERKKQVTLCSNEKYLTRLECGKINGGYCKYDSECNCGFCDTKNNICDYTMGSMDKSRRESEMVVVRFFIVVIAILLISILCCFLGCRINRKRFNKSIK